MAPRLQHMRHRRRSRGGPRGNGVLFCSGRGTSTKPSTTHLAVILFRTTSTRSAGRCRPFPLVLSLLAATILTVSNIMIFFFALAQPSGQLTFYRDEFFCFTDPWAVHLNYENCCVEGPNANDVCFDNPGSSTSSGSSMTSSPLNFNRCCWDTPLYTKTIDCETAELSYCLGKLGMAELLVGDSDDDAFFDGQIDNLLPSETRTTSEDAGGVEQHEDVDQESHMTTAPGEVGSQGDHESSKNPSSGSSSTSSGKKVNIGLKLNQACLRSENTDGSIFGIEKMSN
ncbi:unnamed protein product, partial [Amoebophrya sp. A120]|eukprot:GSA120T00006769001.1